MSDWGDPDFKMFKFFEMTPDLVCIAGKDGYFRSVNPAVIEKLGYTRAELLAQPIVSFIHPEDKDLTHRQRTKLLKGKALLNFQNRYLTKNGKFVWLEWTSIYIPEKEVVFAIAKDITQRKQKEKEIEEKYIKFKSLAIHFKSSLEENRKYLAFELHEELAQLASVVKMDIDSISSNEPHLQESSKMRIEHALTVSELLINSIRRISFAISPNMLEDLGLDAALEWHCREFSVLNGVHCQFQSEYDEALLTAEIRLDFFRICQEALTNIMYHAEAESAEIRIEDKGDKIALIIADNGKGFNVKEQKQTRGLTHIRERVASINGQLSIQSKPGKGTKLIVVVAKQ